jgi:hypothetical protein
VIKRERRRSEQSGGKLTLKTTDSKIELSAEMKARIDLAVDRALMKILTDLIIALQLRRMDKRAADRSRPISTTSREGNKGGARKPDRNNKRQRGDHINHVGASLPEVPGDLC